MYYYKINKCNDYLTFGKNSDVFSDEKLLLLFNSYHKIMNRLKMVKLKQMG